MKFALVYQAGIANVFQVTRFGRLPGTRGATKRVLQHAFSPCEYFIRGAQAAGAETAVYACNMAGDIIERDWNTSLEDAPFSEKFGLRPCLLNTPE